MGLPTVAEYITRFVKGHVPYDLIYEIQSFPTWNERRV